MADVTCKPFTSADDEVVFAVMTMTFTRILRKRVHSVLNPIILFENGFLTWTSSILWRAIVEVRKLPTLQLQV